DGGTGVAPDAFGGAGVDAALDGVCRLASEAFCLARSAALFACAVNCTSESGKLNESVSASAFTGGVFGTAFPLTSVSPSKDRGRIASVAAADGAMVSNAGEDGVISEDGPDGGVWSANNCLSSVEEMACFKSSGTGMLSACAT